MTLGVSEDASRPEIAPQDSWGQCGQLVGHEIKKIEARLQNEGLSGQRRKSDQLRIVQLQNTQQYIGSRGQIAEYRPAAELTLVELDEYYQAQKDTLVSDI